MGSKRSGQRWGVYTSREAQERNELHDARYYLAEALALVLKRHPDLVAVWAQRENQYDAVAQAAVNVMLSFPEAAALKLEFEAKHNVTFNADDMQAAAREAFHNLDYMGD
jgi:hypothetical protein